MGKRMHELPAIQSVETQPHHYSSRRVVSWVEFCTQFLLMIYHYLEKHVQLHLLTIL